MQLNSKWLPWATAIAGIGATFGATTAAVGGVEKGVAEMRRLSEKHAVQPAHRDAASRLALNEERIKVLDEERRDLQQHIEDLKTGQTKIQRRVDTLCVASPRCQVEKRP